VLALWSRLDPAAAGSLLPEFGKRNREPFRSTEVGCRAEENVANGYDRADWTVEMTGPMEGVVSCGGYQARFAVSDLGAVQIIWPSREPMGDTRTIQRVAREVVEHAIRESRV
jgi:hypothetical protein